MEANISFIGLGQMGYGMATNLRKKISPKATMFVNDINTSACEKFVQETSQFGPVEIVPSAKEAAAKSQILISIVPASQHVRQVYLDEENGVIAAPKDGKRLILESSTIDVETTREVGKTIMDAGVGRYIDTPVSGGVRGAALGILAFMVGCPSEDPIGENVRQIVSMMGAPEKIHLCGQLGNGLTSKISNNYLSGTILLALSEAMAFGIRAGVDKDVLAKVINSSSGQSWMADNLNPVPDILPNAPSSNDYKPGFKLEMILKDLGLGVDTAKKQGIEPRMGNIAVEQYRAASQNPECEGKDFTSIYLHINEGK